MVKFNHGPSDLGVSYCACRIRVRAIVPARATGSTWSLVGGVRAPGWAKSPAEDVWAEARATQ